MNYIMEYNSFIGYERIGDFGVNDLVKYSLTKREYDYLLDFCIYHSIDLKFHKFNSFKSFDKSVFSDGIDMFVITTMWYKFVVYKSDDDWFFVFKNEAEGLGQWNECYKCDGVEGVGSLIKDKELYNGV